MSQYDRKEKFEIIVPEWMKKYDFSVGPYEQPVRPRREQTSKSDSDISRLVTNNSKVDAKR
jgi:hypothetical protein